MCECVCVCVCVVCGLDGLMGLCRSDVPCGSNQSWKVRSAQVDDMIFKAQQAAKAAARGSKGSR